MNFYNSIGHAARPFSAGKPLAGLLLLLVGFVHPSTARAQAGFVDPGFLNGMTGPNSWVWSLAPQADGRLLAGGQFTTFNGVPAGEVVRLNPDGSVDTDFSASVTSGEPAVHSVAVQPDGRVLVGGMFAGINGVSRIRLARLHADGAVDSNFVASVNSSQSFTTVSHLAVQANEQIVLGGWFESVNGAPHTNIARLNNNGSLDPGYSAQIDSPPNALLLEADGKVLIGGAFSTVNGQASPHLARLNTNGTLDTAFTVTVDGNVDAFALQPDGKIIIGGGFTLVNGTTRSRIARLNPDGTLDTTFQNGMAGADNYVGCVAVDPGGRVLVGGQFLSLNNVGRTNLARLNSDGSLDTNFLADLDSYPEQLVVQPDSRVILEGSYLTTVNGRSRNRLARLQASRAPVISSPRLVGGAFAFDVNAVAGQTYGVEASTNLPGNWNLILSTNAAGDNFTFSDPKATQFPRRFVRVFR
ncbi:MAG TPA: delta-60 repeat domain-containing protein [Candidatus Acidoferrum sp.]|nr:delta-60 repeat domain-containing protein [Candidatus Acidoferrum sp.]